MIKANRKCYNMQKKQKKGEIIAEVMILISSFSYLCGEMWHNINIVSFKSILLSNKNKNFINFKSTT